MKYYKIITVFILLLIMAGCKKDEIVITPVTPSTNGIISGRITSLITGNPLIQALVTTNPATASVSTDIYGYYYIENVKPGNYSVTANKVNFDSISTKVAVIANATATADIQLKPTIPGILKGTVVAANGSPIIDANITTSPYVGSIKTGSDGKYYIPNIKVGTYIITAERFGFGSKNSTIVIVSDSTKIVDFVLYPIFGTLTGTVTDSNKVSIAGVNITTTPATGSVLTDSVGHYFIPNINTGALTISAKKGGWKTSTVLVTITAGNNQTGDIIMSK